MTKQKDFDDLNYELSDEETGKIKRFLSEDARQFLADQKNGKARERMRFLDMLLITDPLFRDAYVKAMERIDLIRDTISQSLKGIDVAINETQNRITEMQDNAIMLPDGTRIYQDKHGILYTEHGLKLDDEAQMKLKNRDHVSREDYLVETEKLDALRKTKTEIIEYRDHKVTDIEDRLRKATDKEEIDDIMIELEKGMPSEVRNILEHNQSEMKLSSSDFMQAFKKAQNSNEPLDLEKTPDMSIPDLTSSQSVMIKAL